MQQLRSYPHERCHFQINLLVKAFIAAMSSIDHPYQ